MSSIDENLAFSPATELRELILTSEVAPVDITRLYLERSNRLDPQLHTYLTVTSEIGTYPINQWNWDFGDDSTATGADVQHTYTQEGQYTVTLTVTEEFGLSDT